MSRLILGLSFAMCVSLFHAPAAHARRAPRICLKASAVARQLKAAKTQALRYARLFERMRKGTYKSHHGSARTLQGPIMRKFADHFKKQNIYSQWSSYKLRRSTLNFTKGKFTAFKLDLSKLNSKGFTLDGLKSSGWKFKKSAGLMRRDEDTAPCLVKKKISAASLTNLTRKYSASKLQGMYKMKTFLNALRAAQLSNSINKTRTAIATAKKTLRYARKARYYKRKVQRLNRLLKVLARSCSRMLKRKRKRGALDRTSLEKGTTVASHDIEEDEGICSSEFAFADDTSSADSALAGPTLGAGFEINFQTVNDMLQTDEAYNSGAESALGAM